MSSDDARTGDNAEQIANWNSEGGGRWARLAPVLDRMLEPYGRAALDAADVRAGEHVVDVGCGCGATLVALAERTGPSGTVLGLDVSAPMLTVARERTASRANVRVVEADASRASLDDAAHELVFSRFGVMFFEDAVGAFRRLAGTLAPGGRVAFVCWRPLRENAWARVPLEAILPIVGAPATPPAPDAPGPFSLGDATRVRAVLTAAGLRDVRIEPFDHTMPAGPTADLDDAVTHAMEIGPASRALANQDAATLARARTALRAALAKHHTPAGVSLTAAAWVVTARR